MGIQKLREKFLWGNKKGNSLQEYKRKVVNSCRDTNEKQGIFMGTLKKRGKFLLGRHQKIGESQKRLAALEAAISAF